MNLKPGCLVETADGRKGRLLTFTRKPEDPNFVGKSVDMATITIHRDGKPTGEYAEVPVADLLEKTTYVGEFLATSKVDQEKDLDTRIKKLSHADLFKTATELFSDLNPLPAQIVGEEGRNRHEGTAVAKR